MVEYTHTHDAGDPTITDDTHKQCSCCGFQYRSEDDFIRRGTRWRVCSAGHLWFNCECSSTLIVKKGAFPWYRPQDLMRPKAGSVFNRIAGGMEFPCLPTEVLAFQQAVENPDLTAKQIAVVCKSNPAIVLEILRAANAMKASASGTINSIEHAITYIGRPKLKELAYVAAARSVLFATKRYTSAEFWQEAFTIGAVAEELAKRMKVNFTSDDAFLAGIFVNFGKAIAAQLFPDEVDRICAMLKDTDLSRNWNSAEIDLEVHRHAVLGEIAASLWGLPKAITEACGDHHDMNKTLLRSGGFSLVDVVSTATQLSHWINLEPSQIDNIAMNRFQIKAGMNESQTESLVSELLPIRDRVNSILKANFGPEPAS